MPSRTETDLPPATASSLHPDDPCSDRFKTVPSRPITTRSSRPSRRPGASSSSRRRAPPARRSSSRSACTSTRSSSASTASEVRELARGGQGLRHRRRHGHRKDARHPADRRGDPRTHRAAASASSTASARRRPRRRPGTSSSSPPASRAAGSRTATSSRHDTLDRRRDPPDVGRAGAVSRARQARRLPVHLAVGDGRSDVLRALPRLRRRPRRATRSIRRERRR